MGRAFESTDDATRKSRSQAESRVFGVGDFVDGCVRHGCFWKGVVGESDVKRYFRGRIQTGSKRGESNEGRPGRSKRHV